MAKRTKKMNILNITELQNTGVCTYSKCKKKFPDGIIHLSGKYPNLAWWPDGGYLFHYWDTHGFPKEMMIEELSNLVNTPMTQGEVKYYNKTIKKELAVRGRTE